MKKWACVKNDIITNIIVADDDYIEEDPDVLALYDEFVDYEAIAIPDIKIGSYRSGGIWHNALDDFSNTDYSNQNLTNHDFRDTNLDGCNFAGATITGANFRGAVGNFNLIGAIWNGQTIAHGPVFFPNQYYYFMVTDVFTVMGCVSIPTSAVAGMTPAQAAASDTAHPGKPALFWASVQAEFLALIASW